jgi:hypothetical protein
MCTRPHTLTRPKNRPTVLMVCLTCLPTILEIAPKEAAISSLTAPMMLTCSILVVLESVEDPSHVRAANVIVILRRPLLAHADFHRIRGRHERVFLLRRLSPFGAVSIGRILFVPGLPSPPRSTRPPRQAEQ